MIRCGPSPRIRRALEAQLDDGEEDRLPRVDPGKAQHDPKQDEQHPPGQFVRDEHEADCTRFLLDVKESIRRRSELGLGRDR